MALGALMSAYQGRITSDNGKVIRAESEGMSLSRTILFMDRRGRMHMRKTRPLVQRFLLVGSLVVLGVGLLVQAPRAAASDSQDAPAVQCTVQNVAGTYGFLGSGTVLPNSAGFPEGPAATVGIQTFDGQGEWVTHQTLMVNGQVSTGVSPAGPTRSIPTVPLL